MLLREQMKPQSEKQKNEKRTAESERRLSDFALATRFSFLAFVFLVCHTPAQAATGCDGAGNCYVRATATVSGDGSSWTNACPNFSSSYANCDPRSLARGATFWVAAGNYTPTSSFSSPVSGSTRITIRAATIANHGAAADWNSSYAGQVIFNGGNQVTTDYWIFDGQTRTTPTTGYNMKFTAPDIHTDDLVIGNPWGTEGAKNITVKYVELAGSGNSLVDCGVNCGQNLHVANKSDNLYLGYSYLHDPPDGQIEEGPNTGGFADGWMIEHNYFYNDHNNSGTGHTGGIVLVGTNMTIRFNFFKNEQSTSVLDCAAGGPTIPGPWFVYGNIFWWGVGYNQSLSAIVHLNSECGSSSPPFFGGPFYMYNNTVANINGSGSGLYNSDLFSANVPGWTLYMENNVWWNAGNPNAFGTFGDVQLQPGSIWDYNSYGGGTLNAFDTSAHKQIFSGNPFVNSSNDDFHLAAGMTGAQAGVALPAPYNVDMDGNLRGPTGKPWDRGAYQFCQGSGCITPPPPPSSSHFVRVGATGNGTSWANAWGNLDSVSWASIFAGDTVCIAGGSYSGSLTTGASGTAGNPITLKRAVASDPTCGSTSAGWNATYDAQIKMSGTITLQNDYVTIDGMVSNGISITMQNPTNPAYYVGIGVGAPTNGVTLRHIEVAGPCANGQTCNQNGDHRSISLNNWNGSSYDLQNNMTLQYLNLHGACNLLWSAHSTNLLVEHSHFADSSDNTPGNPNCHPNVIAEQDSTNVTFRYNEITHWSVEGIMACPTAACSSSWQIYGNLWHDPDPGVARILEAQNNANGPYLFYNNTIVNVDFLCANTPGSGSFTSGTLGRNNIYWNSPTPCGLPSEDYDYSDKPLSGEAHGQGNAPNPFVNLMGRDYHLQGHTNPGVNLSFPYNTDYDGNTRTTWDRGAYEFCVGSACTPPLDTTPPTVGITAPANSATVSGTITVAGTAADNVAVANVQVSIDGGAYAAASGTTNWTFSLNTTGLTNAPHTISAKATDTSGNLSMVASISVTVNNSAPPPPAPVITSALTASGTMGTAFSYQITASNSPTSFNATGLPTGLTINTSNGLISGTPTAAGSFNVAINATNGGGTGSATLALTVNNLVPPAVSIVPLSTTTVSGTVALIASASSNLGIASVQFQLDGSNLGSPLTAPPFTLSWNTAQAAPGTHSLTAVATDTSGNKTTSAPIAVTVVRGADATPGLRHALVYPNPAVKTDPTIRAFLGMVGSVEITIFDASGRVVHSGSVSGAPSGISNGQYYYDYTWSGHKASGIYFAVIHGKAADGSILRARVRFAVVN